MREARHPHARGLQPLGDVMRGRLAVDRQVGRQDDLLDRPLLRALDELADIEVFRADAVERRQVAAEHVIAPLEGARAFQRPQVAHLLEHAEQGPVAPLVAADGAGVGGVDVAADRAGPHGARDRVQRPDQRLHQHLALLQEVERRAAGRAGPKPWQPRQQLDQSLDIGHGGGLRRAA